MAAARKTASSKSKKADSGKTDRAQGRDTALNRSAPSRGSSSISRRSAAGGSTRKKGESLVVVESPTKAKTIERYLGPGYKVMASYGHVRDLPSRHLGVDTDHDFDPTYEVIPGSKKVVDELKKAAGKAESVYLATDFDREGEAIAWHVLEAAKIDPSRAKRVTFTEITRSAIEEAFRNPREIDHALVDAQQARRILDRLVGYKLSPLLWTKVRRHLSAGRVQSVALRLIVDREREIQNFVSREYWTVDVKLRREKFPQEEAFSARLIEYGGNKIELESEGEAARHADALREATYRVRSVRTREVKRNPPPPFTTSTLQQEASRKLGFSGSRTMAVAQQLYEGVELGEEGQVGLITYMRTDSVHLAREAVEAITSEISRRFGKEYLPEKVRVYKTKARGAQEAHEAIRPTDMRKDPESLRQYLSQDQYRLYRLIWQRSLACQMKEAVFEQTSVDIEASGGYLLRATGQVRRFDGFMRAYVEGKDDEEGEEEGGNLPQLEEGEELALVEVLPEQHFTQPPPRFTDATLIKTLEENGIGRPSTYAPTVAKLLERGYIRREKKKLIPEEAGFVVTDFLVEHFPDIVDVGFTARMEEDLDDIASRKRAWVPVVRDFYEDFQRILEKKEQEVERHLQETDQLCEKCGAKMVVRLGRYGRFLSCSSYPKCKNSKPLAEPEPPPPVGEDCPECGKPLVRKQGRFGAFVGCSGYPECRYIKKENRTTGARCPECNEGELVEKRTRKGRTFYGCSRYPDCGFASWKRPSSLPCPQCGGTVFFERAGSGRCSSCSSEVDLSSEGAGSESAHAVDEEVSSAVSAPTASEGEGRRDVVEA